MTRRDRMVVSVLAVAALIAAMWILVVAPKRNDASAAATALTAAQATLASAQQQVAQARVAASSYAKNLHAVASDYRAVPAVDAVAKLLPTLQRTSTTRRVDFRVITVAAAPATPTAAAPAPAPTATPAGTPVAAGAAPVAPGASAQFSATSFTFTFNGGYRLFQSFLRDLDHFVVVRTDGRIVAHNRLLVINSVALKPQSPGHGNTQAAITASAYSEPPAPQAALGASSPATTPVAASTGIPR
ncbi:MAG: hypothetical protein ACR2ND_14900 [Solirubrobacteraceae bacterium]